MIKMKRKGNVAIIMLVIVALVASTATLLAFAGSGKNFGNQSEQISEVISELNFNHNYVFKTSEIIGREAVKSAGDFKGSFREITNNMDLRIEGMGNYFGKVRNNDFKFEREGENYVLEVNGLFVQAARGENSIKRNFDIKMKFDKNGELIKSPAQGL